MVKEIRIKEGTTAEEVLLFNKIENLTRINLLFGGNGVGKSTLLSSIIENKDIEMISDKEVMVLQYINSEDNLRINRQRREVNKIGDLLRFVNANRYSEGQSILHYFLRFLEDLKEIVRNNRDKDIVVCLDEIDSGLSCENINMILHLLNEDIFKNVQFFISTNNYHFTYCYKKVLDMYTGTWIRINSYEEYFQRLNDGIQIMNNSGKRNFEFLDVY